MSERAIRYLELCGVAPGAITVEQMERTEALMAHPEKIAPADMQRVISGEAAMLP